jgi:hypothetical protein
MLSECGLLVRPGYVRAAASAYVVGMVDRFPHDALFRRRLSGWPYGLWEGFMGAFCLDV